LKILLEEYKECVENPNTKEDELMSVKATLRQVVEEGHQVNSWFPMSLSEQWKNFRYTGSGEIPSMARKWLMAVTVFKGAFSLKGIWNWWYGK
ncbi:hypothetical protein H0W26_00150, partial [Candidatus Dependentiae bacterium]|nr:hypothetical protein [Candidatus Dependentiae bacterium]